MAVANAVRQDRSSTRSTRGTNSEGERNRGTRKTTKSAPSNQSIESLNDRRVRPSTRGSKEANQSSVQEPRRKASTRNRSIVESAGPSTRKRTSTRGESGSVQVEVDRSTPSEFRSSTSRVKVFEARREAQRFVAPTQFLLVMFLVMVVSVFAFGLLRGEPVAQLPGPNRGTDNVDIIFKKDGTTSTNTGILRGN